MAKRQNTSPVKAPSTSRAQLSPAAQQGHAEINHTGATLAQDMLRELECPDMDDEGIAAADLSALENWPRHNRSFRNVVAEYAAKAQEQGPKVLEGFCAVLSDFIACARTGSIQDTESYDRYCGRGSDRQRRTSRPAP